MVVSSITQFELLFGCYKSIKQKENLEALNNFLSPIDILPFEGKAADEAAKIRVMLKSKGTPIGPMDTLIAGQALSIGATLITNNVKEYSRVIGLKVENWA